MILKVLKPTDPKLRKPCKEITRRELRTKKIQNIIESMLDIVYGRSNKGEKRNRDKPMTVGLSANQVGILKRISIVDLAISSKGFNDINVLINPKIIWHSKAKSEFREGCVNLPHIWGMVPRYKSVTVQALDRSGNELTIKAKGWTAVLLQHEIDHLNGNLFIDHLPDPKKAHYVDEDNMQLYREKHKEWDKFEDVSKLLRN